MPLLQWKDGHVSGTWGAFKSVLEYQKVPGFPAWCDLVAFDRAANRVWLVTHCGVWVEGTPKEFGCEFLLDCGV